MPGLSRRRYIIVAGVLVIAVALIAAMAIHIHRLPAPSDPDMPGPHRPEIRDWHDLHAMRYHLEKSYVLMNNLDATTAGYENLVSELADQGKGWQPIGTSNRGFSGSFDGQGYEIRDLFIGRRKENSVGLFGAVDETGVIQNIGVVNVDVVGSSSVGGLVGKNRGVVSNSYITGSVTGREIVGGLVGHSWYGTVVDSYSMGTVTGTSRVGGLLGYSAGTVGNSHSTSSVSGKDHVGGLVGHSSGIVSNSYSSGKVLGGSANANSMPASNSGKASQSSDVIPNTDDDAITLIAPPLGSLNMPRTMIAFTWSSVISDNYTWLLSTNADLSSPIERRSALVATAYMLTRMLNHDTTYYWQVTAMKDGAAIGQAIGVFRTGGFVPVPPRVGGLVGYNHGMVSNCYSTSLVSGSDSAGGLVGQSSGTVMNYYATGNVTGQWFVGGLVGENLGTLSNCYSTGMVAGDWAVGGLVGHVRSGAVSNSFSVGYVAGHWSVGGLSGRIMPEATVSNSFWDTETSGQTSSGGDASGRTMAEMHTIATFAAATWDITAVVFGATNTAFTWNIVEGQTYPFLSWEPVS